MIHEKICLSKNGMYAFLFILRWDTYLAMTDVQIHWFSIVNSVIVVFFLSGILSMIIVKTIRRDIARYNQEDSVSFTLK